MTVHSDRCVVFMGTNLKIEMNELEAFCGGQFSKGPRGKFI